MAVFNRHQQEVAKLPQDEQTFSAIGRFIVEFSNLEMVLKLWVAETVNLSSEFHDQIMTHDFAMLCNIAQTVLPQDMKEGAGQALKPIIGRFHEMNTHRVRIAHGWWLFGTSGVRHVTRQKLRSEIHYDNAVEIAALADSIDALDLELREWHRSYRLKS
ncbi:MAG: hypothetical protein R3D82_16065 [Xanthobacteraceae bacterium]